MAVRELHRLAAQSKPQQLVAEADAEDRHSAVGELAQGVNRVCHRSRVPRAVREEDAVRLELADAIGWPLRRDHGHAAAVLDEEPEDVALNPIVESDEWMLGVGRPRRG